MDKNTPTTLDFICIGAAKSATTTLYDLLKDHPDIVMPSNKEAPFFSDNRIYKRGLARYLAENFPAYKDSQKLGTITPQYMIGGPDVTFEDVAERIKTDIPDIKIIVLLRHPIERAYSHYKMLKQRGYETRTFEQAAEAIIAGEDATLPNYDMPDSDYLLFSRYGEILRQYYSRFAKDNVLLLTTDELKSEPQSVVNRCLEFIGLNADYAPAIPTKHSRKGGGKPKSMLLTPGFLFRIPFIKTIWQNYTPQTVRRKVEYGINLWNTKPDDERLSLDSKIYHSLVGYFADDIRELERVSGVSMPWKEWRK